MGELVGEHEKLSTVSARLQALRHPWPATQSPDTDPFGERAFRAAPQAPGSIQVLSRLAWLRALLERVCAA